VLASVTCVTPARFQNRNSSRQSRSVPAPVEVQISIPSDAGSRPSASVSRRSVSNAACASGPAGRASIIQPSPHLAMRFSVFSWCPPNQTGTRPPGGSGLMPASSIRCHLPVKSTCGAAHSACITCTCSSERRPRLPKFSLSPVNSTGFQPTPTPKRNLPPQSSAREAACFAASTAWRCARISTPVAKSSFVTPARKPNITNGSWKKSAEVLRSRGQSGREATLTPST
jgi:hypothetical protein